MPKFRNPAVERFIAALGSELIVGQVLIRANAVGHEFRHVVDRDKPVSSLRSIAIEELRELAQFTESGMFRPLKSAPTLRSGWTTSSRSLSDLERIFDHLYPGFIADWHVAQAAAPPITNYREFTSRQSGMYRITTMLSDEQARDMIRACCHVRFCLKRRLWTVEGLPSDPSGEKSMIPCLEPCAILLEFSRKAVRMHQEENAEAALSISELETLRDGLEHSGGGATSGSGVREADFGAAANPRRQQLVLQKIQRMLSETKSKRPSGDVPGAARG